MTTNKLIEDFWEEVKILNNKSSIGYERNAISRLGQFTMIEVVNKILATISKDFFYEPNFNEYLELAIKERLDKQRGDILDIIEKKIDEETNLALEDGYQHKIRVLEEFKNSLKELR